MRLPRTKFGWKWVKIRSWWYSLCCFINVIWFGIFSASICFSSHFFFRCWFILLLDSLTRTHNKNWIYPWWNGNSCVSTTVDRMRVAVFQQHNARCNINSESIARRTYFGGNSLWFLATRSHPMELNLIWIYQECVCVHVFFSLCALIFDSM